MAKQVFTCIDNTTLNATDTAASVEAFCRHTKELGVENVHVAAVCVYPRFVGVAKHELEGSGIGVVSVAGAFPHGQLPTELKVEEVKYAVNRNYIAHNLCISQGNLVPHHRVKESHGIYLVNNG